MHDWHEAWEEEAKEEEAEEEPYSVSEPLPVLHYGPPRRTAFSFARLPRRRYSSASGAPGLPAGPEGPRSLPQPLTRAADEAGSGPAMAVPALDMIPGRHTTADMQVLGGRETLAAIRHPASPSTQPVTGSFPAKDSSAPRQRRLGRDLVTSAVFSDKATEER